MIVSRCLNVSLSCTSLMFFTVPEPQVSGDVKTSVWITVPEPQMSGDVKTSVRITVPEPQMSGDVKTSVRITVPEPQMSGDVKTSVWMIVSLCLNVSFPCTSLICFLQSPRREKFLPHISHECGFSPVEDNQKINS